MDFKADISTTPEKPKKKVLIVIGTLAVGGGAEKVAATLGNELFKKGHDVHILTFYEASEKYDFNGTYHTLNESLKNHRLFKIFGVPKRIWKINRFIKNNDVDVAISFLEEANIYTLSAKKTFGLKLPVIVSVRNNTRSRKWLFQKAMRVLYPSAKKVVTVTKAIEEMMREDFSLKNLQTIYNPINTTLIAEKLKEPLPEADKWLESESELFIHIGRHTKQKGQWHLLRVFSEYVNKNPKAKLIMIGGGEDTSKITDFIKNNNLESSIFVLGTKDNVLPYLRQAKALILTSLWEGMPNVLLESLANNTPIIATDCQTGPREIMAPELPVDMDILYPYQTKYGWLTAPLSQNEDYTSIIHKPLSVSETQLVNALDELATRKMERVTFEERVKDFELNTIINEWESLL
ncbi:glycosyltransferase [Candidatus Kaiserbacteria bacterium]|nr:glycosyltransferase [Candidatus Kaiserbacteria bacterium]